MFEIEAKGEPLTLLTYMNIDMHFAFSFYRVTMVVRDYILLTLFIIEVPQSCKTAVQFLPNSDQRKQN